MRKVSIKKLLIDIIAMAQKKYQFHLLHYAILDNHFHFFIRTVEDGETISRIMQFIKAQLAQRYNRMHGRTGPFWNERFSDTIIELTESPQFVFMWILWYISYNPVRKGYVRDPRDYQFSSVRFYLEKDYQSPLKLTFHDYFLNLGKNFSTRVRRLLKFEDLYRKRLFPDIVFN
jgi:REP element-mobilizing transposase RayT